MPQFRVNFCNTLLNSDGFPFKVVQRVVLVRGAKTAEAAAQEACRLFERLERIPHWRLRAQHLEVETGNGVAAETAPGPPHPRRSAADTPGKP